jgi:hypothetical protein
MHRSTNLSDYCLQSYQERQKYKEAFQLTQKNIEKVKNIALQKIKYPEYQEAFDYVDNLFPRAKIKDVMIYKVAYRDLVKMGYGGVEGFYDPVSKIVVVSGAHKKEPTFNKECSVVAKITRDEVIVHELCHYCYVFEGNRSTSVELKEEFAYGWSIGYLRGKGHSDEAIIKNNFLPFLINVSYTQATKNILAWAKITERKYNSFKNFERKEFNRRYGKKIFKRAKEIAMERGFKIINIYNKKLEEGTGFIDEAPNCNRFDLLDL